METLPVTIYRTWFGLFLILLAGCSVIYLLYVGLEELFLSGALNPNVIWGIGLFTIVLVALVTIVQAYVYSLSRVTILEEGVVVKNWITLFVTTDQSFEWLRVSRASVNKGSIFAQLLNYGTLTIETNGGQVQVVAKWIPDVERWQALIQERADAATDEVGITPMVFK